MNCDQCFMFFQLTQEQSNLLERVMEPEKTYHVLKFLEQSILAGMLMKFIIQEDLKVETTYASLCPGYETPKICMTDLSKISA